MKYILPFAILLGVINACRMVPERDHDIIAPRDSRSEPFIQPDSLVLDGDFDAAEVLLLGMLDNNANGPLEDDILWRLSGLYHGRGMPDAGVDLFERLEESGYGDLTGWKVSLLDLSRNSEEALLLVAPGDVLLRMWLSRNMDNPGLPVIIPAPVDMAERFVRVSLAPEGSLTPEQTMLAAADAVHLPSLEQRLLAELALRTRSGSSWVDDLLEQIPESDEKASLEAERMAFLQAGSRDDWTSMLDRGDAAAGVAARVLLRSYPEDFGESWRIVDALLNAGDITTASSLAASSGNSVFLTGLRMALDFEAGRNAAVLENCSLVDSMAPDTLRARADLFRARTLRAAGNSRQAYDAYRDFAASWPLDPTAREAAYLAGKYYDGEQEWANAADAYLTSLRSTGTWEGDERAYWRGGFCLYMSGQGSKGDSLWHEAIRLWPYGYWRDEMLFWSARYANRSGYHTSEVHLLEQVASEHPWEFYGMLAAERIGRQYALRLRPTSITLCDHQETERAMDMCSRGYGALAVEMLRYGESGDPGRRAIALGLLGEHGQSISLLRALDTRLREENRSMLPDSLLCWFFPSPYKSLCETATDTMHLSADYVQGIMREESYFDRWVISSAGARGLIQLMPGTAYDVARWNGLPALSEEQFFEPGNSILYGSLYINRQWRNYQGESVLFLAAYNAGPGNASRWVDMHGWDPQDPELYIEQITYRETRIYVKKVLRSSWIYERIRT
jgi:tetratricopeptide (TPR) repeat protein